MARIWETNTGRQMASFAGDAISSYATAAFSPDETFLVLNSGDGTTRVWNVALAGIYGSRLRDSVCANYLIGSQEFTDHEIRDPVLLAIDKDDRVARNPCLRRGPLDWEYYAHLAKYWTGWNAASTTRELSR